MFAFISVAINFADFEGKDVDILQEYSAEDGSIHGEVQLSLYIADSSVVSLETVVTEVEAIMADNHHEHQRTDEAHQLLFSARRCQQNVMYFYDF